jgi:hypothetical protein
VTGRVCEKVSQNVARPTYLKNTLYITGIVEKVTQIWSTSVIFKKLPKINNVPIGANKK